MASASVATKITTVGLPRLIKKLGADLTTEELASALSQTGKDARAFLGPLLPRRTGLSAGKLSLQTAPAFAKISVPSRPYIFLEAGSQYPLASRKHVRRVGVKASLLRVRPRRFMSKTRSRIRLNLPSIVEKMKQRVLARWSQA